MINNFTNIKNFKGLVTHDNVIHALSDKHEPYKSFASKCNNVETFTTSVHIADNFKIPHDELVNAIDKLRHRVEINKDNRNTFKPSWCNYTNKSGLIIKAFRMNRHHFEVALLMSGCLSNGARARNMFAFFDAFKREEVLVKKEVRAEVRVRYLSMQIAQAKYFFRKFRA